MNTYLLFKSIHLIAVISWMAGLLYLPRIFVYHSEAIKNNKPTLKDFEIHLATIFTEVRLKQYIEIRSLDACEWDCHCAGPAFYTGLLYGNLDEAYEIINKWNKSDVMNAYVEAPEKGLKTIINNKSILEWSKIFLNLSRNGLIKRNIKKIKCVL